MNNTLQMKIFSPVESVDGDGGNSMIVLPNEVVASLDGYHGARAQDVANTTGYHVLAYERPYSGSNQRYSFGLRYELNRNAVQTFSNTAAALDKAIEREGPSRIYIAGHSAATVDVIGVAHAERTEFDGLIATDPPGMRRTRPFAEITDYVKYQLIDERRKPDSVSDPYENTPQEVPTTKAQLIMRTAGELIVYGGYGSSPQSLELLKKIAMGQKGLGVAVFFPEHTFTASRVLQEVIKQELELLRPDGEGAPLFVELIDDTYHSRFDGYKLFGRTIAGAICEFAAADSD